MTVFTAVRSAILRAEGTQVYEVFASTDQVCVEMADLANEVAADIAKAHDWQALTTVHTITADGSEAYDLPSDYDRMVLSADVDDPATWFWGYDPFLTVNDWMRFRNGQLATVAPGGWIILGGQINFYPDPTGQATFPYISNAWARSSGGDAKSAFDADTDTFVLPERLLTLGLIWRWRSQKKLDYSEELATYDLALAQAIGRDRGSYILPGSRRRISARLAYSGRAIP